MKRPRSASARGVALGFALAVATCAFAASAGPGDSRDPAAAESLFTRGIDLLKKDDWVEACKAFEASMKLDPSVGAQMNVARCADHDGHLAQAWVGFKKAKALNAETPLEKRKANVDSYVDGEIARLEPRLPYVTIKLVVEPSKDGHTAAIGELTALHIDRDDAPVPAEGLGIEVPIDPGKHVFHASADGYEPATAELGISEAAHRQVELHLVPKPPPPTEASTKSKSTTPPPAEPDRGAPVLYAGITVGALGAASIVVSAITGGLALSDRGTLDDLVKAKHCTELAGELQCDAGSQAQAHDALSRGRTLSVVSTVTLFAGLTAGATGIITAIVGATPPRKRSERARVVVVPVAGPGVAALSVGGAFD